MTAGPTILRKAVQIADRITKKLNLPSDVLFYRAITDDSTGTKTYAAAVPLKAIVDWKQRQLRTPQGVLSVSRASVLFLDTAALSAATNGEGIDDNDVIVLADGTSGPILDMTGFVDAGTTHPIATEVWLG